MRITRPWAALLLGLPIAFMIAFFVIPFLVVVIESLRPQGTEFGLANYAKVVGDVYYWQVLLFTFEVSLWVTLMALLIGYPLAYFIVNVVENRTMRRLCYIIVITPLFTSNIVRAFGWTVLLGREGLVNDALVALRIIPRPMRLLYTEFSIIIGMTYIMTPFMVLTVASVLQNIDKSLREAARDLGAGRIMTFLKVTLPLSLPGVVAGSLIVFTLSVSAYVTPSIMSGGRRTVMSMLIFEQYSAALNFRFGATLAVTLLVTTLLLITFYVMLVERNRPHTA